MASNWQPELRRTWSAATGGAAVRSILLSPRGKVAAATAAALHLYDAPPGFAPRGELRGHPAGVTAAAFSGKGTDVVAGGADGFLKWWQVETGDELCSTQVPTDGSSSGGDASGGVGEVACSRAGLVAVASGRLLCIFGSGGEHLHTLTVRPSGAPLRHLAWLDDATVAGCCGTEAILWHVQHDSCEEVAAFGTNPAAAITALVASPSGRYLAAACDNRTVQVWDREREGGADPALCIADGIDGAVGPLSWDSSSRLLAAAVGSEALVWDVAAAREGRADTSYVCIGFEQGSAVTSLAFQPNGTLLAVAADNGLCLVFDSAVFGTGSVASGLVTHAASGRLASSAVTDGEAEGDGAAAVADGGSITALVWHTMGSLLVGTSTGVVGALQPLRATIQRTAAEGHGDAAALRRGQQDPGAKRRPLPSQQQPTGAGAPAYAAPLSAPKPVGGARGGAQPAGWGGEPLMTNGVAGPAGGVDGYDAPPLGAAAGRGGRGRGLRGGPAGGRYGPGGPQAYGMQQQPYVKRDAGGAAGAPKLPSVAMAPQAAAGAVSPEQQASMMVATQWGMMPAAMSPAMWRQMGVSYAMNPYGQMVPMAAGMAPAMPGYPAAMAGAAMAQPMPPAPPGGGRGAPYAPRPGMGGPSSGRGGGGRGAAMGGNGGSQGADAGGGGRGMGASNAPYARRPGPPGSAGDRPSRSDSASPQQPYAQQPPPPPPLQAGRDEREGSPPVQQHAVHEQQQHGSGQQERPARGPGSGAQQRPAYGAGRAAAGDGGSSNGSGGGAGGAYHHAQQQQAPPPPPPPTSGAPPLSPAQAMAPGAAVMARPPYGMAPVYMFPQPGMPGMMPAWGMYPGQMTAFPTPGGYVMYPAGAYGAPAGAAAAAAALAPQLSAGVVSTDGGGDAAGSGGAGRRNGGGDRSGYGGYAAASEDGAGDHHGGGGYARSSGYGGAAPTGPLFTLYVGNLAPSVDEAALSAQFEQFGPVERAQIIRDRETQEPRGYGFLTFSSSAPGAAQAAMARLNNTALPGPFAGRIVRVSPSNKWRTGGSGAAGDAA